MSTGVQTVLVFYDFIPIHSQLQALSDGITTLKLVCSHLSSDTFCKNLNNYFEIAQNKSYQKDDLLLAKRIKRAAFYIVGNALFGVLDSEYGEDMSKAMHKVRANEEYLLNLWQNNTSVVDDIINIIKQSAKITSQRLGKMHAIINMMDNVENNTMKRWVVRVGMF